MDLDNLKLYLGKNGVWEYYYESGKIKEKGNYSQGILEGFKYLKTSKKEGLWKTYYESGKLNEERNYKDGKLISKECWDEDGNKIECK